MLPSIYSHGRRRALVAILGASMSMLMVMSVSACVRAHPIEMNEPATVAIQRPEKAPREEFRYYNDFWRAITDDNLKAAWILAETHDQRKFADVLEAWFSGNPDAADAADVPLLTSPDSTVRAAARLTHGAILASESAWEELAAFSDTAGHDSRDAAGIESWAPAFRTAHRSLQFSDSVAHLRITRSASGVVMVPVTINGVTRRFWLDTGSSITIISSELAEASGLEASGKDTLELLTAVGRLPARPAIARDLTLGNAQLKQMPAMIVQSASLQMRSEGHESSEHIDGVLGFDVIRLLDITIDDGRGFVDVRQPIVLQSSVTKGRNLEWFGVPVVTLISERGAPLHLALDTGAGETFGTPALVTKTGTHWTAAERRIGGFGGNSTERGLLVPSVRVFLGNVPLVLQRIFLYEARYPTIFALDGTLGAEVGRGAALRIDMTNGVLEVVTH